MRRDPEAFRERFKAWKNGELVYLNGRPTELPNYRGGEDLQELPEGFLFDTQMPELTVYGDVERAKRQNNWLISRGLFPRFFSLGNGKGVQEIKTPTEKGLEIVSPEFYALAGLRPGGDIIAPITKNQIKNIGRAAIKQATKHPSITPEVTHFYHGSPVKFDTFSADFIGSGEGGSKVMQGINLWPTEKIGNAPKFANIKSPDAPLHLGVSSTPLGGELNPTVYDVSGRGLKLYTASPREVKGLSQSDLISQGYDGIQTPNQVTVFPESIGKLSIDKQSTIEEFILAHPEVERWTPWTIDNQKMQDIINLSRMSKRTASYKQYRGGKDGQNWLTSAILGASIAEDPAIATAAGWLLTNNGVVQKPNLSTRLLGRALTELSFFSPTNPASAATTGLLNLGGKAVRMFRPASTKSLTLPTKVDVEPLSDINNLTEADFKNWIQGKEVETLKDLVPEYLHPATKDVPVDVIESILNSITPRLIKMRPFLNPQEVENSVLNAVTRKYNEYPVEAYLRAGEGSTLGIHVPSTDFISIRQGSVNKSLQHELRHSLYDLYNPALAEEKLMDRAYNHLFPKKIETWTTNGDARKLLIGPEANRKMPVPQLNRLIDAASKKQVVKAVHDANAYGASYIDNLIKEYGEVPDRIVNAIKRAMKYVAVGNAVAPVVKNKSKK